MKTRSKAMKKRLDQVAELGCLVCDDLGNEDTPAQIHHQLGQGRDDNKVLPLCPYHHLDGGYGIAVHDGTRTWEKIYGTQASMVERVNLLVPVVES